MDIPKMKELPKVYIFKENELSKIDLESNISSHTMPGVGIMNNNDGFKVCLKDYNFFKDGKLGNDEKREKYMRELDNDSTHIYKTKSKFSLIMIGLSIAIFLSFLDGTILTTALANILNDFGSLSDMTWLAASYMITSTSFQPLYGKISDIFGRKITLIIALSIFLIGSLLCGLSTDLNMLILSRALTGAGGGGLVCLAVIIISDIVPLRKRGIYMSVTGLMFTISSLSGPLIGGLISDLVGWRWTFFINVPLCILCIGIIVILLKLPVPVGNLISKLKSIDYLGLVLLVSGNISLLIGVGWGGKVYEWISAPVLGSISAGLFLLVLFFIVEAKIAIDPIMPLHIINRNVLSANFTMFFIVFPYFFILFYMPIYFQIAKGESATLAGLELLPLMLSTVLCSVLSGIYTSRTGKYRLMNQLGTFLCLLGCIILGFIIRPEISRAEEMVCMLLISGGFGLCIQTSTIICQTATKEKDGAVVTSLVNFSQSIGSVIALVFSSAIYKYILSNYIINLSVIVTEDMLESKQNFLILEGEVRDAALSALFYTFMICFRYMIIASFIAFFASLCLKHIPMR